MSAPSPRHPTGSPGGGPIRRRRAGEAAVAVAALAVIVAVIVIGAGLVLGYRPVVITSGSMGAAAPQGAMAVAGPADSIEVGDIVVMRRAGRATVTHRVVELQPGPDGTTLAVTRGDANAERDAVPYRLGDDELVVRWVLPGAGAAVRSPLTPYAGLAVVSLAVALAVTAALRRIWRSGPAERDRAVPDGPPEPGRRSVADRARFAVRIAVVGALVCGTSVAFALYQGVESVGGNTFTTAECYDARLGGVQHGALVSSPSGSSTATIAPVDPASAFLLFSVRSAAGDAAASMVVGRLSDATTLRFEQATPVGGSAAPVAIEWSVVAYDCGVSVQRGLVGGDGDEQLDVAIAPVDPASSFVLTSTAPAATGTPFGAGLLLSGELTGPANLRLEAAAGTVLDAQQPIAWQVVTFTAPGDAAVQTQLATLAPAVATDTVSLPTPVDPTATVVLASPRSAAGGGELGERVVRARLLDSSTVEITRLLTTESVDVALQVVELRDGTVVQRGVLDLPAGTASAAVPLTPLDPARSAALSTVQAPGSASGGASGHAASTAVAEASATMTLTGSDGLTVERGATASAASFAWQVVNWGGPSWADAASPWRQRIDVRAQAVATPDGYSTAVTVDHAALVAAGLSGAGGDDVRLWRFDGTTWTELHRVLDDASAWNRADTTIWFRTREPLAAEQGASYWLYLGNPAPAPALADPSEVWLLTEGFEGGTTGAFADRTAGTGWYQALPWTRRIDLAVAAAAIDVDLADQPVLVRLTSADLAAHAQPDGSDLRFTAADGSTLLDHDLEAWDPLTGTLDAWVRVPQLSATTDTSLRLYYGALDAPRRERPRQVWPGEAAWHLERDPAGAAPTLDDHGPGAHDGLAFGDPVLVGTASGPAVALDGSADRFETAPIGSVGAVLSVSAWFEADVLSPAPVLVAQGDPTSSTGVFELGLWPDTPNAAAGRIRLRAGTTTVEVVGGSIGVGGWHHLAATWDGATVILYLDGTPVGTAPLAGVITADAQPVVLGASAAGDGAFTGRLGDARLAPTAWSAAEVRFRDANLRAPAGTVTASAPAAGSWFDQGQWSERFPLQVDPAKVAGPLTDYPLLVQLTSPELAAAAQPDGDDLVFVGGDGVTRLDHELESWDPLTGSLTAWVRLPSLDAAIGTGLFLYAGNPDAGDQQDPVGVWGAEADLVLHGP